jgi:hypothetical protein
MGRALNASVIPSSSRVSRQGAVRRQLGRDLLRQCRVQAALLVDPRQLRKLASLVGRQLVSLPTL